MKQSTRDRKKRRRPIGGPCRRLWLESLEDRRLLATITVDSLADNLEVDGQITLREAIRAANSDVIADSAEGVQQGNGADTIVFAEELAGKTIELNLVGDVNFGHSALLISSDITIRGDVAEGITIARDSSAPAMRLFHVTGRDINGDPTGTLTLERVTLQGGLAQGGHGGDGGDGGGGGGGPGVGGAIANEGILRIFDSTLTDNHAIGGLGGRLIAGAVGGGGGGAGFVGSSLDGTDATVVSLGNGRVSDGGRGGGDFGGAGGFGYFNFNFDPAFRADAAGAAGYYVPTPYGGGGGGGGSAYGGFNAYLQNPPPGRGDGYAGHGGSTGDKNGSGGGGGGFGFGSDQGFVGVGGHGGDASFGGGGGGGGGAFGQNGPSGNAAMATSGSGGLGGFGGGNGGNGRASTGANWQSSSWGGGGGGGAGLGGAIFNDFDAAVLIRNSTISGNSATGGDGGRRASDGGNGGDGGSGYGGGIFNVDGAVTIINSTVVENRVERGERGSSSGQHGDEDGGAVYSLQLERNVAVVLKNSIFADSIFAETSGKADVVLSGGAASGTSNLIEVANGVPSSLIATQDDPNLGPLRDNSGPTQTHKPNAGSPVIDTANTAEAPATDQRGFARPRDGDGDGAAEADIGAVEVRRLVLALSLSSMSENGGTASGTVTRSDTETNGPLLITLSSSDTTEATVPGSVEIEDGAEAAMFTVTAVDDTDYDGTKTVTITASAFGYFDDTAVIDVTDFEPASVTLTNKLLSIAEDASTIMRRKVADIQLLDSGFGTTQLTLSGEDAAMFEIRDLDPAGKAVFLLPGVTLDFETNSTLNVTVEADDPLVPGSPDDTADLAILVIDVNEPPTSVILENIVDSIPESLDVSARTKVADIVISDDALGTEVITLSGDDEALFEVIDGSLFVRAGAEIDFETNPQLDVTISVDDLQVGTSPDATTSLSITVTDVEEVGWQNPDNRFDVNGLDGVTALDVLILVNFINNNPNPELPPPPAGPHDFLDVNNDGLVTAQDVLDVINEINKAAEPELHEPEGEQTSSQLRLVDGPNPVQPPAPEPVNPQAATPQNALPQSTVPQAESLESEALSAVAPPTPFSAAAQSPLVAVTLPLSDSSPLDRLAEPLDMDRGVMETPRLATALRAPSRDDGYETLPASNIDDSRLEDILDEIAPDVHQSWIWLG